MKRRALLAATPAAVAGCLGSPPASPASTTTADAEPDADFAVTDFSVSTRKVAPEHRYLVRTTKVYSADAVDRHAENPTVVDVSRIEDPEVRAALKDVLSEGRVRRDAIPDGLRDTTRRVDFFTWDATTSPDDTYSHWGVEVFEANPDRAPAVQFDAELVDDAVSAMDPGAVRFALSNVGDRTRKVFSGTVPPFGVLWAERGGSGGDSADDYLLWRNYTEEGCVNFTDRGVISCDIGKITSIRPGETIERTYQLRPDNPAGGPLAAGDYAVSDTLSYHRESQGPSTEVAWRVAFTVGEA